jgi:hypothetical protein
MNAWGFHMKHRRLVFFSFPLFLSGIHDVSFRGGNDCEYDKVIRLKLRMRSNSLE